MREAHRVALAGSGFEALAIALFLLLLLATLLP